MTVSISHRDVDAAQTQPATVCTLLRDLGVEHACVETQRTALGTWLMIHTPQRPLRISFLENGYGPLVKATDGKRGDSGRLP
jgi:hypothetical protein